MDYSFLVGVHFCDDLSASKTGLSTFTASPKFSMKRESFQGGGGMPELCFSDSDFDRIPDCRYVSMLMHMHVYLHVDLFVLHLSLE
jgi:1-phosphatidylinositol-4-phosphate 5-kinase